jgi:hypothetical protein
LLILYPSYAYIWPYHAVAFSALEFLGNLDNISTLNQRSKFRSSQKIKNEKYNLIGPSMQSLRDRNFASGFFGAFSIELNNGIKGNLKNR